MKIRQIVRKNKLLFILLISISIVLLWVYKDFLFMRKLYLYKDVGADTYYSYWPNISNFWRNVHSGNFSFWKFNMGLGSNIYVENLLIFDPFNLILLFFNERFFPAVLVYTAVLKIILSGVFFYFLLKYYGFKNYAVLIGALIYSFNGYIILWGQHYFFATAIVYVPLILLGFERLMKESKWFLFVISIFLMSSFSYYFLYMTSIFLLLYAIYRYISLYKFDLKEMGVFTLKAIGYYMLGVMLSGAALMPSCYVTLTSARINNGLAPVSIFNSLEYFATLILRAFSNTILNSTNKFIGVDNYYESPILYCSLLALLLIPQLFKMAEKKEKKLLVSFTGIVIISLSFQFFSSFFNAFQGPIYRWTFLIIITEILCTVKVIDFIERGYKIDFKLLAATITVLISAYIICNLEIIHMGKLKSSYFSILRGSTIITAVYFTLYFFLILIYSDVRFKLIGKSVLFILVMVEIGSVSHFTVNRNRIIADISEIKNSAGYYDETNGVIQYINKIDESYFRINKDYYSVQLNDALIQNYWGTASYNSLNSSSYINFLNEFDQPFLLNSNKYIVGFNNENYLNTLVSVKYYITKNNNVPYGYSYMKSFGDIKLYKNDLYLPICYAYENYINLKDFNKLDEISKKRVLLKSVLLKNQDPHDLKKITEINAVNLLSAKNKVTYKNIDAEYSKFPELIEYEVKNKDSYFIVPLKSNQNIKDLSVSFNLTSKAATVSKVFWSDNGNDFNETNSYLFTVYPGTRNYSLNFHTGNSNIKFLKIHIGNSGSFKISKIIVNNTDNIDYEENVNSLKRDDINIKVNKDSYITGNTNLDKNKYICFSIPYDKGWSIKIDGKKEKLEKVNIGFMGLYLTEGYHKFELKYIPPYFYTGLTASITAVIIILGLNLKSIFKF